MNNELALKTWNGYLRPDGRKGVRNVVLIMYTVECSSHVAHAIAANEPDAHVVGFHGCYDNAYAIRLMLALAQHPNVAAVLTVGLGCEYTQPRKIAEVVSNSGRPAEWFNIQEHGGTASSIDHGKQLVCQLRRQAAQREQRVSMTAADLVVGAECGGSDATSGLAGNPVVGRFFDRLVDAGGTAIFEESVELIGLKDALVKRGADQPAGRELDAAYEKAMSYCRTVRQYSVSPGNFAGGLTTIEEKSLGAYAKSGARPIQGVVKVAQRPPRPGLWLLDSVPDSHFLQFGYTNPNDSEGIIDLISSGCQIVLFVTGRGSVIGAPIAPLIKVTGNYGTWTRLQDDMDFDASRALSGDASLDELADELADLATRVADGEKTKPEHLNHREFCIPYKHQDAGCHA